MSTSNISIILGMKVKQFRHKLGISLKTLSQKSGMSTSYLNEIEKGKKYPKSDKLMMLAEGLDVAYDDLVSLKLDPELNPFSSVLEAPLIQKFPFHIFGLKAKDVLDLMSDKPREMGTLVRMLAELGRTYDMRVEHFFYTALRSYQILNRNYFEDLEHAVRKFRKDLGWEPDYAPGFEDLWELLTEDYDYQQFTAVPQEELTSFRSVFLPKDRTLFMNPKLSDRQKAFVAGRELAFQVLDLKERAYSSPTLTVGSFEQVLNNFKASYFADALLIPEKQLVGGLKALFRQPRWDAAEFMSMFEKFLVTPEMLFYRLSEVLPRNFKTNRIHFLKFSRKRNGQQVHLSKHLNMSRVHIPHGLSLKEHFCRRWLSVRILDELEALSVPEPIVDTQRSMFIGSGKEYFCFSIAYPETMQPEQLTSVTIGFQVDEAFKRTIRFWNDPSIARQELGQTCERCPLSASQCSQRVAPASIYEEQQNLKTRQEKLEQLLEV